MTPHLIALGAALPAPSYVLQPTLILTLCVLAGIGTVMLLPTKLESSFRGIGGTLMLAAVVLLAGIGIHASEHHMGVYFWIFSLIALGGAVRVVTHPKPVYAALYFVLTVFATAGLFILQSAEFMAVALVIIYAGAILITYVFVIMLASQSTDAKGALPAATNYDTTSRDPVIAAVIGFALMGIMLFVIFDKAEGVAAPLASNNAAAESRGGADVQGGTQQLGKYLFQNQSVNLELAGLILTMSMVGAIVIARRRVITSEPEGQRTPEMEVAPMTPMDDSPHSIPVFGTARPVKSQPEM